MAAPQHTPDELRQLIHSAQPGDKFGPYTLASRTQLEPPRLLWQIVVTRGANAWTAIYTATPAGTVGKVYQVTDQDGRLWFPAWWDGTWIDGGVV